MERLNTSIAAARISSSVIWPVLVSVPCAGCDGDCCPKSGCCAAGLPWVLDWLGAGVDAGDDELLLDEELDEELDDELEGGAGIELLDCWVSGGLQAARKKTSTVTAEKIKLFFRCIII